jgi:hypothetical protein
MFSCLPRINTAIAMVWRHISNSMNSTWAVKVYKQKRKNLVEYIYIYIKKINWIGCQWQTFTTCYTNTQFRRKYMLSRKHILFHILTKKLIYTRYYHNCFIFSVSNISHLMLMPDRQTDRNWVVSQGRAQFPFPRYRFPNSSSRGTQS